MREEEVGLGGHANDIDIGEEDRLRANWYSLLAHLLSDPADENMLLLARSWEGDDSDLGRAIATLSAAAKGATPDAVREEFFKLFVGVGHGELQPYGSYYLTGFLHEKPLARLRGDMRQLQIERNEDVKEPEDHIASLCEIMAGLITGAFGAPADLATQQKFFDDHIACWAPRFFEDLQAAKSAAFYMPVGSIGSLFLAVESQAFEMAA